MELYSDIYKMPMRVYHPWKKSEIILSEVGDGFNDFKKRLINVANFIEKEKPSYALQEIKNAFMLLHNIEHERSPLEEALKLLCVNESDHDKIKDLTLEEVIEKVESVKKKSLPK